MTRGLKDTTLANGWLNSIRGTGATSFEERRRHLTDLEERPGNTRLTGKQTVEAVVDQGRYLNGVDRRQGDRIDRVSLGNAWRRKGGFTSFGAATAHAATVAVPPRATTCDLGRRIVPEVGVEPTRPLYRTMTF